jgi:DNA-binding winged helix-turn-helix (wHTH) protein
LAIRFLDCVLDGGARSLLRNGGPLHLTPKAFDVLWLLVSERPRVVGKAEILDRVWPGTFVTDASLARTIHEIREALGVDAGPGAIRTVHGHGYAFGAEVFEVEPDRRVTIASDRQVRAWLLIGTRAIALSDGEALIGRDPAAAAPLDALLASWHHARLHVTDAQITIEDLGSKNGTRLRGQRLVTATILQDGDDILIGATRIVFRLGERLAETATDVSR